MHGYKWPINCTRTRMLISASSSGRSRRSVGRADESQHAAVVESGAEEKAAGEKGKCLLASAEGSAVPMYAKTYSRYCRLAATFIQ